MFQISKIERASKSKPLYHIYADDTLLLTVSEETLIRFTLSKGQIISQEQLDAIRRYDQVQRCVQQALRYLSRRGHFVRELQRKLKQKGFETSVIEQAVAYLRDKNYLNDEQLSDLFIKDGINLKKYGPLLLKKKLLEKGVAPEIIEGRLQKAYPKELQEQTARALSEKKIKSFTPRDSVQKRRQKLAAFLQQRGFGWDIIQVMLAQLPPEEPENEGE